MKKIYLLLIAFLGSFGMWSQTTIYSENCGTTASGNPTVATYTGWQNTTPIAYTGNATARTSTASTGYTGASGSVNVFFAAAGGQTLQISGINTSAFATSDLQLSFGWLTTTAAAVITVEHSTDGTTWTPITIPANPNTSWNLKTITTPGLPQTTNLWLRFTGPATGSGMRVDDIKVLGVSASCVLAPGTPTTNCDAVTSGIDTYTITIPFTGGGTASYTITPTTGTVGGDNPSLVASGNITISGTNEGVDNSISITGGTCNFTIPVTAPSCKPINTLPFSEPFNYADATNLNSTQAWNILNSGDNIVAETTSLTYTGVTSTGNKATFAGAGAESFTPFTLTNSGSIYARFLVSGTDLTGITAGGITYFALFNGDNLGASTAARVWIRENAGQYQFGLSPTTSSAAIVWSANSYALGTTQYLLLNYNFADNSLALFENPTIPSTAGPAVSLNLATALTSVGGFMLRQDTAALTPVMKVDELLIDTVAPDGLTLGSKSFDTIAGLQIYPNPARTVLNVSSNSFAAKTIAIYNVLGKEVINTTVMNNQVNVASLAKGVYVLKVTEEGKTATRKLVIE